MLNHTVRRWVLLKKVIGHESDTQPTELKSFYKTSSRIIKIVTNIAQ